MAVQVPLYSENLDFPVMESGFINHVQPFHDTADFPPCSDEFQRRRREIDVFLQLQNERLKYAIQQQKKQQISTLLSSLETTTMAAMRKTEHDLAKARNRARELDESLKMAEMETRAWQKAAMENEAMVATLNNTLDQIKERVYSDSSQAQDAESVCDFGGGEEEEKLGFEEDQNWGKISKIWCKWCKLQRSSVVFLPCKHVCVCRGCGSFLGMCPVCGSVKEGSIEVILN